MVGDKGVPQYGREEILSSIQNILQ